MTRYEVNCPSKKRKNFLLGFRKLLEKKSWGRKLLGNIREYRIQKAIRKAIRKYRTLNILTNRELTDDV